MHSLEMVRGRVDDLHRAGRRDVWSATDRRRGARSLVRALARRGR